jgi:hypothetical protein
LTFGLAELPVLCWKQNSKRRSSLQDSPVLKSPGKLKYSLAHRRLRAQASLEPLALISKQINLETQFREVISEINQGWLQNRLPDANHRQN